MLITDIPKLTQYPPYKVNTRLSFLPNLVKSWLDDENLDLYPDFQRGHVWSNIQRVKFVEFILKGGKTSPLYFNTNTPYISYTPTPINSFVIVDGLQRLTSLLLFLDDKLKVFDHLKSEIIDIDILLRELYITILINDLPTKKQILQWYLEINSFGTPHTLSEISKVQYLLSLQP